MAYYMFQASFTSEAWAKMVQEPQNREQSIRPMIEKLGGKLIGYWFAFGESDAVVIAQFPDAVSAAAASLAVFHSSMRWCVHRIRTIVRTMASRLTYPS